MADPAEALHHQDPGGEKSLPAFIPAIDFLAFIAPRGDMIDGTGKSIRRGRAMAQVYQAKMSCYKVCPRLLCRRFQLRAPTPAPFRQNRLPDFRYQKIPRNRDIFVVRKRLPFYRDGAGVKCFSAEERTPVTDGFISDR